MDEREKSYKRVRERQEEFHEEKLKLISEGREMLNSVGNAVLEFLSVSTTAANSALAMFEEGRRTYRVMGETYKAIAESLSEHKQWNARTEPSDYFFFLLGHKSTVMNMST